MERALAGGGKDHRADSRLTRLQDACRRFKVLPQAIMQLFYRID
jgi:hypothetical protein